MARKRKEITESKVRGSSRNKTDLKVGDPVMILTGGNSSKGKVLKGATGKIKKFLPKRDRVVVEGLNMIKRHKRAQSNNEPAGVYEYEGSIHISNIMYYSEKLGRPVRIAKKVLEDGKKVRAYRDADSGQLEQLDLV